VLDIGGGVGAISHALLESGARAATGVDASAAYVEAAREEAERRGLGERLSIRHGDFVALAPDVPEADFVTLDRVICCYPDAAALVGLSAARARRACGLVFPRSTWWTRVALALVNAVLWLARNPMRTFVHPTALVEDRLRRAGFTRRFHRGYVFWQVMVWSRVARAPGGAPESPT
jgi:magnesium-protoporphyrin O-methyltransferase